MKTQLKKNVLVEVDLRRPLAINCGHRLKGAIYNVPDDTKTSMHFKQ